MAKDIYENIDDVKCSLDNAQRSFRKNNGLRGELDLMLAEASIRYLREMEQAEAGSGFGSAFGTGRLRRLVVCRHYAWRRGKTSGYAERCGAAG